MIIMIIYTKYSIGKNYIQLQPSFTNKYDSVNNSNKNDNNTAIIMFLLSVWPQFSDSSYTSKLTHFHFAQK